MNESLRKEIRSGEVLAAIESADGREVWRTSKSPVGTLLRAYLAHELDERELKGGVLYANQLGLALALFAKRAGVTQCVAAKLSDPGQQKLREEGVAVIFDRRIKLVRSSKNPEIVCPIEAALVDAKEDVGRWEFLEVRFGSNERAAAESEARIC
ncbi:DUF1893 domain-containing protein [Thermophilibacter immobilis]|uniref:DUF1893 domain-containing protein n=1 Tax=Thermophilibacter immobilis TaxID=2779519 RepID=A0A7S7M8X4_9ACTN|nr:DUF1893 domain-containing protein [Thermophilibacter immobilis]QOY60869.1 DUF1893 domain-containing protein [Thermophilibacter immobilis]